MSQTPYDYSKRQGLYPVSWEAFHGLCKALAAAAARFEPEIILPVGRGGCYPGMLLAHLLQVEAWPVRLSRRVNDVVTYDRPQWSVEPPAWTAGRRALIVDEMCSTGETLQVVKAKAEALGAAGARSAVLYAHTWGAHIPDYIGLITDALVLNPWDREIFRAGVFQFHLEYAQALAQQGLDFEPGLLIPAPVFRLAKG